MLKKAMIILLVSCSILLSSGSVFSETLTLATLNWQPFYGRDLEENGFFAALSREAFKRAGYELELVFLPWKRALEMAKQGQYDGLLGAYYEEDRAKDFYFTAPIAQNEEVFIQKKGRGITYTDIQELKKVKIGGIRGAAPISELIAKGFDVKEVAYDLISIRMLFADRVDVIIIGKQYFNYMLNNENELKTLQGKFDIIMPPFKSYALYCPITKKRSDAQEIVDRFNTALESMKADGTYDSILKRFGQK